MYDTGRVGKGDREKLLLICETGFEEAALPTASEERKKQLLNFAVVGGGRKSPHTYCC